MSGGTLVLRPRKLRTSDGEASDAKSLPPLRGAFSDHLSPRGSTLQSSIKPTRRASSHWGHVEPLGSDRSRFVANILSQATAFPQQNLEPVGDTPLCPDRSRENMVALPQA